MPVPGPLVRGRVYEAVLEHIAEPKYYLVVSNNIRNRKLPQVLAVRLTTTKKPPMPSIVELGAAEVFHGRVLCDDIEAIWPDEVRRDLGALTPNAMAQVEAGLRAALGMASRA